MQQVAGQLDEDDDGKHSTSTGILFNIIVDVLSPKARSISPLLHQDKDECVSGEPIVRLDTSTPASG